MSKDTEANLDAIDKIQEMKPSKESVIYLKELNIIDTTVLMHVGGCTGDVKLSCILTDFLKKALAEQRAEIYEIDFNGHLKTVIEVKGSEIKILRSMNGSGFPIKNEDVKIEALKEKA